ncbi:hypothetical protein [Candidatus Williamhamiltonella defendens]|uniref:Uncharacterized protein n=1 Tax=Candidatus Hamiltonella defensa (Bemisia tabaci) TaxID=672795 RepID=A0A249DYU3_9ENTR|nr:hypothetical protein [Candidatus Hamiltonella defensa]ASX26708.1 hypothetical protein BA171_06680 [Candidatus Hamiltonella defensa (Bemisia tabaci)]
MTTNTFALNTELRPLLEATAAQTGASLWVEGMVDAFQANHADLPVDIEHAMNLPLALFTALGLSAQATEAQAVSAIHQMKTDKDKALNSVSHPSLEKFVPRTDHDAALNRAQGNRTPGASSAH